MFETTLFDKAVAHFRTAQLIHDMQSDDEEMLNLCAYHLQQAVELSIKFVLEMNGVEYPKTHSIDQLVALANQTGTDIHMTEYLDEHSEMLSQWESNARYIIGYQIELRKITRALKEIDEYLAIIAQIS